MKKTLSQFKKDVKRGMLIEYKRNVVYPQVDNQTGDMSKFMYSTVGYEKNVPERMQGVRYVSHVDTTGFYLKQGYENGDNKRGSFCGYPKASELDYQDNDFVIYDTSEMGQVFQERHYTIHVIN